MLLLLFVVARGGRHWPPDEAAGLCTNVILNRMNSRRTRTLFMKLGLLLIRLGGKGRCTFGS